MMSEFGRGPGATMMDSVGGVICMVDLYFLLHILAGTLFIDFFWLNRLFGTGCISVEFCSHPVILCSAHSGPYNKCVCCSLCTGGQPPAQGMMGSVQGLHVVFGSGFVTSVLRASQQKQLSDSDRKPHCCVGLPPSHILRASVFTALAQQKYATSTVHISHRM